MSIVESMFFAIGITSTVGLGIFILVQILTLFDRVDALEESQKKRRK